MIRFLNVGAENSVNVNKIISIIKSDSNQARRLIKQAKDDDILIDATSGKKNNSVIITEERIIISNNKADTLRKRANADI